MASIINLEDLPELVMDEITSFLNHKELLALEQVARKLKYAVDSHFYRTDHLIIGPLPKVEEHFYDDEAMAKDKKCLDGLLKIIKRCGSNLRIIQITFKDHFDSDSDTDSFCQYTLYFKHIFASPEMSDNCPNIETIIASPNKYIDFHMLNQQKVVLPFTDTEMYANNIKQFKGESCKLRSIGLFYIFDHSGQQEHLYEHILNLYSNLELITHAFPGENFHKFLPQFIEKGLKDLNILSYINFDDAKTFCNLGKDLRTLLLNLNITTDDDVEALNKLHLSENVKLAITIERRVNDFFARLKESVCNSIVKCDVDQLTDCSRMDKLKNLEEFKITHLEQLKIIAEEPFTKLKGIRDDYTLCRNGRWCHCSDCKNCNIKNPCKLQSYLVQLLANKGNQLTFIRITAVSCISIDVVCKAIKHCTAMKSVRFGNLVIGTPLTVTALDMRAICLLPKLQNFVFSVVCRLEDDTCRLLRELMSTTVKEHLDFQFEYKYETSQTDEGEVYWTVQKYALYRTHF